MWKIRRLGMGVLFVAAVVSATASRQVLAAAAESATAAEERQRELIELLGSDAAPAEKAITCKRLAIYGDERAVPALAALLSDEKLAAWARIALEVIPGREADEALRGSMGSLRGRLLVGVINSIGVRRDAAAIDLLVERLADADVEVASAAAVALGRIGGTRATAVLEETLAGGPAAVRPAVAEACILCAERLLAEGKRAEAARLYDVVRGAEVPKLRAIEATRGAILARGSAGVPLLAEQLRSSDRVRFAIGLRTARELSGREVTEVLVAELGRATPKRQVPLILALADRGDTTAVGAVLRAAQGASEEVRIVAVRVLRRLGDASCVPALLDAAVEPDEALSQTALNVLAELPGEKVDEDLVARLGGATGKSREVLIELCGRRRLRAAVPALLKAAEDADGRVRSGALTALGHTVTFGELPVLIARVARPQERPEETEAAANALRAACERMPDREACAKRLVAAMSEAPVPAKCRMLEILSVMGGAEALRAVGAAAKDSDAEMQEVGSRLLGEWMGVEAAPVLLELARSAPAAKYKLRTLRGYIRLARQFSMPEKQRAEMCMTALKTAERDAEKKLVLEVMERYPSMEMLKVAVDAAKDPSLKRHAAGISLVIAQKIGGDSVDVQKLLAQVGQERITLEIVKAEYGAGARVKDVTEILRRQAGGFPLIVLPSSSYNSSFGGDPVPGTVKQLKVQYRINGKLGEASFAEDATILLPMP